MREVRHIVAACLILGLVVFVFGVTDPAYAAIFSAASTSERVGCGVAAGVPAASTARTRAFSAGLS